MLTKGRQRPLEAEVIMLWVLILDEIFILFVQTIIGQMHIPIIFIKFSGVSFWGEPCKALLIDINS